MNNYSPGDPVWIISDQNHCPARIEATVTSRGSYNGLYCQVEVPSEPCPVTKNGHWRIQTKYLRPRRDTYDGDEKQTNFKLLEDLTGGWNPQEGKNSNPLTERESEKEKSDAI